MLLIGSQIDKFQKTEKAGFLKWKIEMLISGFTLLDAPEKQIKPSGNPLPTKLKAWQAHTYSNIRIPDFEL